VPARRHQHILKGLLRGKVVALKILRCVGIREPITVLEDIRRESTQWSKLNHRHILPLLGLFLPPLSLYPAMVSEFMPNGTLVDYLNKNPDSNRVYMLSGVASGILYLHSLPDPIIHRDIRGMNIFVDRYGEPVVADFGSAQTLHPMASGIKPPSSLLFCVRWTSPEGLQASQCEITEKADVYSFACLSIEVFTGKIPFEHLIKDGAVVIEVLVKNGRPPRPCGPAAHQLSDSIWSMMMKCWALDPSDRPPMADIHLFLSSLL